MNDFLSIDEALTHLKKEHSNTGFLEGGWGARWYRLEPVADRLRELNELHTLLHNPRSADGTPGPERLANMFRI
jgi:hypothetical protein